MVKFQSKNNKAPEVVEQQELSFIGVHGKVPHNHILSSKGFNTSEFALLIILNILLS